MGPGSAAQHCMLRCARDTGRTMLNFLARRIAQIVPTLFFVSVLIFSLQQLLPGDPALVMAGEERDPAVIEQIRQQYRLWQARPIPHLFWGKWVVTRARG